MCSSVRGVGEQLQCVCEREGEGGGGKGVGGNMCVCVCVCSHDCARMCLYVLKHMCAWMCVPLRVCVSMCVCVYMLSANDWGLSSIICRIHQCKGPVPPHEIWPHNMGSPGGQRQEKNLMTSR